jgi:hypothetical protein
VNPQHVFAIGMPRFRYKGIMFVFGPAKTEFINLYETNRCQNSKKGISCGMAEAGI